MEPIIAPVDKELIKAELTPDRFMRDTRKGGNKIYIIDCNNAPNVMREIGRLREIAFRYPGGGTGLPLDIDEFDTMDPPCQQLIVWNPDAEEIIGGYRFIVGENIRNDEMGRPRIATEVLTGLCTPYNRVRPFFRYARIPIFESRCERIIRSR